jgi:hypothetical protein
MVKRIRGSSTRPGQRARLQRSAARPTTPSDATSTVAAPRPAGLTAQEEARAAELEAQLVAEEKAAAAAQTRGRRPAPDTAPAPAARGGLAAQAADEYAYVVRDVRRIAVVAGSLFAILLVLYVVTSMAGIRL